MRLLEIWVATPLAEAVGWTLLHSLWEGAIISVALATALAAIRSARARYFAAWAAMFVMLWGIGLTLVRVMPEGVHSPHTLGSPAFPPWNVQTEMDGRGPSGTALAALVPWLTPFWIVGVWIFALKQVGGWVSVCRWRRRGVCYAPERWQKDLVRLSAQLRLTRPILLLESCLAEIPIVVGHIRPVILMPIGLLAGLPAGQVEAILLHELAHIRRYDYLANVLQQLVETLLFYHPAVWWISRVLRAERENCCDDVVVEMRGSVHEYAVALVTLEQNRWSAREPGVAAAGGSLVKRIRRLLCPKGATGPWTPLFATLILIASAVVGLAAWPLGQPRQGAAATEPEAEAPLAPGIVQLKPFPDAPLPHLRLTADSRTVFETLARLADLNVTFTSDFQARPITVDLTNVKIEEALRVVSDQTGSFWKPVASNIILVIPDNENNRREYGDRSEQSSFDKWLKEEVVYIITDEERAAFRKLATDEERDTFIKQFWERRNPNPGSKENEFKKEYYRRIEYANEQFASARPGWNTDRGHMYIIYGPPDEIDSHPANMPYPFEVWTYLHLEGVGDNVPFTFIDQTGRGDYHLATPPWKWPAKKRFPSG